MTTHTVWCTDHATYDDANAPGGVAGYCRHNLPAPNGSDDDWIGVEAGHVLLPGGDRSPAEAREYALRLLTAATLAELEQP